MHTRFFAFMQADAHITYNVYIVHCTCINVQYMSVTRRFTGDGCQKSNEKNQYSSLDRTNLMRDGLLEIDMVLSGLSVVSHVGF